MALPDELQTEIDAGVYFARRLKETRRARDLTPSMRVDLARSGLDDDQLEDAVTKFGAPKGEGWGLSTVMQELLSSEPTSVEVDDISSLQANLKTQGYLPPGFEPNGVYDPLTHAAFRRSERDGREHQQQGAHWGATTVREAIEFLSHTLPSGVIQGVVGAAKGFVEQAPETAERLGVVGTAGVGAGIGTLIAPGIGTAIGAGVGAAGGLVAELFVDDEEDEESNLLETLLPAEYSDLQEFFEDLGWVATAASLISGTGMAVKGVQAGVGAARTGGWLAKGALEKPGWATTLTAAAARKAGMKGSAEWITEKGLQHGLLAQHTRPLMQSINGAYTGASAAGIGSRLAAGIAPEETTIEKAIGEAPRPELGAIDELASFVLYPQRFLPTSFLSKTKAGTWESRTLSKTLEDVLGDTRMFPHWHVHTRPGVDGKMPSRGEIRQAIVDNYTTRPGQSWDTAKVELATTDNWLRMEYGIFRKTHDDIAELRGTDYRFHADYEGVKADKRAQMIRRLNGDDESEVRALTRELLDYSERPVTTMDGPAGFAAWMQGLGGRNSDISFMGRFINANREAQKLTRRWQAGDVEAQIMGRRRFRASEDAQQLTDEIASLEKTEGRLERGLKKGRVPANKAAEANQELISLRSQLADRRSTLEALGDTTEEITDFTLIPMRLDVRDDTGRLVAPGGTSEQDILGLAKRYRASSRQVVATGKGVASPKQLIDQVDAYGEAISSLNATKQELVHRGLFTRAEMFGDAVKDVSPLNDSSILSRLDDVSSHHARDVAVDEVTGKRFEALGYKLVAAPTDSVLYFDEAPKIAEAFGIGDYALRARVWDTVGLSPRRMTDRSLFALRLGHESSELQQVLEEVQLPMTGQQGQRELHDWMRIHNKDAVIDDTEFASIGEKAGRVFKTPLEAMRYRVDTRELSPDMIRKALKLDEAVEAGGHAMSIDRARDVSNKIYGAIKRGGAYGSEAHLLSPIDSARMIAKSTKMNGLPGFTDFMRTLHVPDGAMRKPVTRAVGAGVGGVVGYELGGDEEGYQKWVGAVLGGAGGMFTLPKFAKGTFGYLPDHLQRLNGALRYTLSFTFDAGRYSEQNMIAMLKADLPGFLSPKRKIAQMAREVWDMDPEVAWQEAMQFYDRVNGTRIMGMIDDADKRLFQRGMLGFSPRHFEAVQAYMLHKRGWDMKRIEETVALIGRYGTGRTAFEKSANFVFFPLSFSKKLISTIGDALFQAPARAMLTHVGLKTFDEVGGLDEAGDWVDEHLPLMRQLYRINNLAYGISPGRFFLEGLDDNRTNVGKAAQIFSSIFVPSGAATPLAQAFGGAGDAAVNFFSPIVLAGEDVKGLPEILDRFVPAWRDLQSYTRSVGEQYSAVREGEGQYTQLQKFLDTKKELTASLEPVAQALGYASAEGLLQSDVGAPLAETQEAIHRTLGEKYPAALRLSSEFENTAEIDKQALWQLRNKEDRTQAEDLILSLADMEATMPVIAEQAGLGAEEVRARLAPIMRKMAKLMGTDRRFIELWDRFLSRNYGPLRRVA